MREWTYFPRAADDRFALAYERALSELGSVDGVVIDLRGNLAEVWAPFAATNRLATVVGTNTAGEVLGAVKLHCR